MKRLTPIILTLLIGATQAVAQSYSLKQAQAYALQNSYNAKLSDIDIAIAEKKVNETISIGLPQISGSASYQNFIKQPVQLIPAQFFGGPEGEFAEVVFGTEQNASLELSGTQLIFNGSYLVGLQTVRTFMDLSKNQNKKNQLEVKDAVAQAYYTVLVAEENVAVLRENMTLTEKTFNDTKALYENGLVEEQDAEQLELIFGNLKNNLANAERQVELAYDLLKFQMGLNVNDKLELSDKLESFSVPVVDENFLTLKPDLSNHIDLQLASTYVRLQELNLKNERSKYLPSLAGFMSHQQNAFRNEFNFFDTDESWFPTTVWGINLNVPVFSSFQRKNVVAQAGLELEKARITQQQAEEGVQLEVKRAKSDYTAALDNLGNAQDNLKLAEKIRNKTLIKYEEGLSSSFELSQSDTQFQQAQGQYINSLFQLLSSKSKLDKALSKF